MTSNKCITLRIGDHIFFCGKSVYNDILEQSKQAPDLAMFGAVDKHSHHFFGLIKRAKIIDTLRANNFNLCEVLTTYPKRVYFDIDANLTNGETLDIPDVFHIIKKYFNIKDKHLTVAGYETEAKVSYHIVCKNLYIHNADELYKFKQIARYVKSLGGKCAYIDDTVYSLNRQMKCIFQSKPDKDVAMPLYPVEHNLEDFFISNFIPDKTPSYFDCVKIPTKSLASLDVDIKPEKVITPRELPLSIASNEDILNARKLLDITPSEQDSGHAHRWKVASFCYHNGLTEGDYMNWFYKSCPADDRIKKVKKFWTDPDLANPTYAVSLQGFVKYLAKWYPELTVDNHNTGHFLNSFELGVPTVEIDRIEEEHFNSNDRVVIFNIGMGGGKTTTTLRYLKLNAKKSFVWLAPRQTLVLNTSYRMNNEYDIKHVSHMDVGSEKTRLTKAKRLLICNQSLHYLTDEQKFDIVVIDEIETVLLSWLDEETHGAKMGQNFRRFCHILRTARKIILLDAFTTTKTINLLKSLDVRLDDIVVFTSKYKPAEKTLTVNKDFDEILAKIVDAFFRGEKSYIFYPYKRGTEKTHYGIVEFDKKIKETIRKRKLDEAKTDAEKLKIYENEQIATSYLYYAESKEKNNLGDINAMWADADYILTTSSITVGVNYEGKDFHNVFLIVSGATNNPRDVIQSSMRIRYPQNININILFFDIKTKDIKKFPLYYQDNDEIYKALVVQNLREIQATFTDAFLKFCELTNYHFDGALTDLLKSRRKKKFVNDMFTSRQLIDYKKVAKAGDMKIEELERLIYSRCAGVVERLTVERYYFDAYFANLNENDREYIWNSNSRQFFKGITNEIFKLVLADNNAETMHDVNMEKLAVSQATIDHIKKHYSITNTKKPTFLVVKVINDCLGFEAIASKKDKRNKHTSFELTDKYKYLDELLERKKINDEEAKQKAREVAFIEDCKEAEYKKKLDEYFATVKEEDYYFGLDVHGDEVLMCRIPKPKRDL